MTFVLVSLGVPTPTPLAYRCIGSNLAEFRIAATLQQRDESWSKAVVA
jgi:hypothetical protein